ncbi:PREDICTED: uncharacterized protein LOC104817861 [Tarenaya hassleriana]|uniref:uncharacterized protein LOC104817861 n=1 Tax=Tarenaya hassleriana TaxID=28532 RepID=UPI00053C8562|nr:PREDICTED: uncharacterized protein LOC104817861 [Tarenaya hassleriana]
MLEMFQLLFTVVTAEAAVIIALSFGSPLRRVLVTVLDLLKQGRGPLVTKTVAATVLVLFGSVLFNAVHIHRRVSESGGIANQTDQILFANRLLETFLIGALLFLAMVIDRLHYCSRELQITRRNLEIATKKIKGA